MIDFDLNVNGLVLAGKYRLCKVVNRGGFGAVCLGEHLFMQRTVAIKLLQIQNPNPSRHDANTLRFLREAKVISQLKSEATVTVYDYGVEESLCYMVMEFIDGQSLQELLAHSGAIDAKRAVKIAVQILDSLDEAHYHNILHRDLKPANVMLTHDFRGHERVKVVDFGVAKALEELQISESNECITQENVFIGTPRYAAPEQLFVQQLTYSTDLYAVGMLMWDMLVGKQLIPGSSLYDCCFYHVKNKDVPIKLPTHFEPDLAKIIERALERHWPDRWQSANDLKQALVVWLRQREVDLAELEGSPSVSFSTFTQIESIERGLLDEDSLAFVRGKSTVDPNVDDFDPWGIERRDLFSDQGNELDIDHSPQVTQPESHRTLERDRFFHDLSPSHIDALWDDDFDALEEQESQHESHTQPIPERSAMIMEGFVRR